MSLIKKLIILIEALNILFIDKRENDGGKALMDFY